MNDFSESLLKEISLRGDYLINQQVSTIYFGGGTPSLLPTRSLEQLMEKLHGSFAVTADAEVTLEANPDDIDESSLAAWRQAGINRLSIGVQSFFDSDLQWMNRAHNAQQALRSISMAQDAGLTNLTIDLIYGSPQLSDKRWQENMQQAIDLQIPHLSCYALTLETGTALEVMTRKKTVPRVVAEDQARQFLMMTDFLTDHGFEHYEISNLAKPGHRSRHNSAYWSGAHYLGLGPSAHSFNGASRQWNIANNALYIQSVNAGLTKFEEETLTDTQRFNEYVMTALRTMEGIDLAKVRADFGGQSASALVRASAKYIESSSLEERNDRLILTRQGKLFADGIAAELFV